MTPHSTDRAHSISPLDMFGAAPHQSGSEIGPAHAFEDVLNKVTAPAKAAFHRQPAQKVAADQPGRETEAPRENSPDRVRTPAGKKQPIRADQTNGPRRKDNDHEPSDAPTTDQIAAAPTSDTAQASPQSQDQQGGPNAAADETPPVDATSEQVLGNSADAAQPLVATAALLEGAQPIASPEASAPETRAATVPNKENPLAVNKPALDLGKSNTPGVVALSPTESAAADPGNGTVSLAELGTNPDGGTDPLVAIDGQSAAAAAEIQPAEPSDNGKDKERGDSSGNDAPQQNTGDTPQGVTPNLDTLTNPQTQSTAAAPPLTTSDTPATTKDAPQPQTSTSPITAVVQPAASRLPQHVLTRTEGHRGHNPAPVPVDSARFLSRVAKAFLSAQQRDGNEVRLRLSPPELGSLRLQVSVQDGVMVARMETETEAARSSLVNNLPALRERLEEQGIRVERFDIDLMQRPSTGTPDRPSDPQQQHEPQPLRPLRAQQAISDAPTPTSLGSNWNGQGRLNIII